jgi:hypothetical protein
MTETHEELQAKLAEARKKQILDAASRVIAMSGYHRATIKQIAKEARVADGASSGRRTLPRRSPETSRPSLLDTCGIAFN